MRFDIRCPTLAAAAVFLAVYLVCFGLYAVAQEPMMAAGSYVLHFDLTGMNRFITWGSFFAGLVFGTASPAAVAAAFGALYNRLLDRTPTPAARRERVRA